MRIGAIASALLLTVGCGGAAQSGGPSVAPGPASPSEAPPAESDTRPDPVAASFPSTLTLPREAAIHDQCGQRGGSLAAAQLPEHVPACERGVTLLGVTLVLGGHEVLFVGFRDERPSWVDGPVIFGGGLILDHTETLSVEDLLGRLAPWPDLSAEQQQALLQGVLLAEGTYDQFVTRIDVRRLQHEWPETATALLRWPPGIAADEAGFHVRVWARSGFSSRAGSCNYLHRIELTVRRDGGLIRREDRGFASGTQLGEPCGEPLP